MKVAAALACLLIGCAMHPEVGVIAPTPAIGLAHSDKTLALALAPDVLADDVVVDCSGGGGGGACKLHVTGFHQTLQNGFKSGFAGVYTLVPSAADLTLKLTSLAFDFDPDQHLAIRFKAELTTSDGQTVGRSFGTLPYSRTRASFEPAAALREELAQMFEKIAAECFGHAPAGSGS